MFQNSPNFKPFENVKKQKIGNTHFIRSGRPLPKTLEEWELEQGMLKKINDPSIDLGYRKKVLSILRPSKLYERKSCWN